MKTTLAILVSVLAMSAPVDAATLYTAPLAAGRTIGIGDVECRVTNVAQSPTTVRIRAYLGVALLTDSGEIEVAPNAIAKLRIGAGSGGRFHCRFDTSGGKRRVRAGACSIFDDWFGSDGGCQAVLPAY